MDKLPRGHHTRSRSLEDFENKFKQGVVTKAIEKAKKLEDTVRVLEIGCGEGRVLMELIANLLNNGTFLA
ncbi:MAG: hypothetical protein AAB283_02415 [Planctomycetota bacterium]